MYGGVLGLLVLRSSAFAVFLTAAVDPDDLLRGLRRASLRSALTATLATRLFAGAGRDAQRLEDARRCRAGRRGAARLAVLRAVTPARWTARPTSPRRSRCAATAARGGAAADAAPWSRHDRAFMASAVAMVALTVARASAPVRLRCLSGSPPLGPARCWRSALARRARCCRSPTAGGSRHDAARARARHLPLPGRRRAPSLRGRLASRRGGRAGGACRARSASGKSTLLRAASGLVPHFHGGDVRRRGARRRVGHARARAGARSPRVAGLAVPGSRVAGRADDGARRARLPAGEPRPGRRRWRAGSRRRRSRSASRPAGSPDARLSGGELQRVALGAALAGRPQLVLLDEPTSQLDPVAGDELIWLLRRLNEEWGMTILLAEHRLERCLPAADRVVAMADGAIACDAPPRDFLAWAADAAPELQTPRRGCSARRRCARRPRASRRRARRCATPGFDLDAARPTASSPGAAQPPRAPGTARCRAELRRRLARAPRWRGGPARRRLWRRAGERVALMGRNGAGKSTLLTAPPA